MSSDNPTLIPVPFHGDTITCIETPEGVLVAIRPICDRIGLNVSGQIQKLKRETRWRGVLMHMPSAGGVQEMWCIPLVKLSGWLSAITTSRVNPEVREALARYQDEADTVLDRHFRLRRAGADMELAELRARLQICQQHLLAWVPGWAQIRASWAAGLLNDGSMHRRLRMSRARWMGERMQMEDCGLVPAGGAPDARPETLAAQLRELEFQLKAAGKWDHALNRPRQGDLFNA